MTQEYGPRRSRATTKPWPWCPPPLFYRCPVCGKINISMGGGTVETSAGSCCGQAMERLEPIGRRELPGDIELDYEITGGFNDNAVRISWKLDAPNKALEWIYLQTFAGGYIKYLQDGKKPPMVFPLADEDAYSYCDENPCLECVFRCKRGFVFYAYIRGFGLVEYPLERMSAQWQTGGQVTEGTRT